MDFIQTEMHCHTNLVSPCSDISPKSIVQEHCNAGYGYVFITDHYHPIVFEHKRLKKKSWEEKVDYYLRGYKKTKKAAKNTDLKVFLAMEITLNTKKGIDFLVYGITEEFLYKTKYLYNLEYGEFYNLMKQNGFLVFQAHPYRKASSPVEPICYDGIEIINTNTQHNSKNKMAIEFASHNNLLLISGSDVHREADIARAGILLPAGLSNGQEVAEYIKNTGSPELIVTFRA